MKNIKNYIGVIALIAAIGCGDDGDTDTDASITLTDGGADSGTDAGGDTCNAEGLPDIAEEAFPRCSADTASCFEGCTTDACVTACLEADTTETYSEPTYGDLDCETCLNLSITVCLAQGPCEDEWDAYECCLTDCVDGGSDVATCQEGECNAETLAFFDTCSGDNYTECLDEYATCFATATETDGGVTDAGTDTDAGVADAGVDAGE